MPLVRIDLAKGKPATFRTAVAETIYDAMLETLKVPANDRFQVVAEHAETDFFVDATYLGVTRTADAVLIQVTLNDGRSVEQKKQFYKAVADGLHERVGFRREDVFISLVEVKKENWSFGNGDAQYA